MILHCRADESASRFPLQSAAPICDPMVNQKLLELELPDHSSYLHCIEILPQLLHTV